MSKFQRRFIKYQTFTLNRLARHISPLKIASSKILTGLTPWRMKSREKNQRMTKVVRVVPRTTGDPRQVFVEIPTLQDLFEGRRRPSRRD